MFSLELYQIFLLSSALIFVLVLFYISIQKFEIAIILFTLSTVAASVFYRNIEEWHIEEVPTGIGGYLRGGLLLFTGIIGLIYYIKRIRVHEGTLPYHYIFLYIFLIFSISSTFYSIDVKNTFVRSSLFISLSMFLLGLYSWLKNENDFNKYLNLLFYIVTIILLANFVALFVAPSRVWWWKTPSRFLGLWSHPNEAGGFNFIAFPIILWKLYNTSGNKKYLIYILILLNTSLQIITGSRTSIIIAVLSILIWLFLYREWIKILILSIIFSFAAIYITQHNISSFKRSQGSNLTDLTERQDIWKGAYIFAQAKPFNGYGYGVESKIFDNQKLYDISGTSLDINAQTPLHNGYLSIFIGGGLVGLLLWLLVLIIPIYFVFKIPFSSFKVYIIATIIPILLSNFVESALTGYLGISDIFFWLAWALAGRIGIYYLNEVPQKSDTEIMIVENYV